MELGGGVENQHIHKYHVYGKKETQTTTNSTLKTARFLT